MEQEANLKISSPAFEQGAPIPQTYTCDGENVNPPLRIEGIPANTACLALILDDPDAPDGTFTHWVAWDIPPQPDFAENSNLSGITGKNSFGENNYKGPCPPPGDKHRYYVKVYALNSKLGLDPGSSLRALENLLQDKTIAFGELMGTYKRQG